MRIAIVDDDAGDLSTVTDYITDYIIKNHVELSNNMVVKTYNRAAEFIKAFVKESFDLIVLDIWLKGVTGIQIAQFIRMKDRDCTICFVTNSDEHILQGYLVFAMGYFLKPITEHEAEFKKMFDYIYPRLLAKHREITIPIIRGTPVALPYDAIYYVDINSAHRVRFVTARREFITSINYEECRRQLLTDQRFMECHYRIIVNMDHIQSMKDEDFVMDNGDRVPISHRKRTETRLIYMNHLAHRDD